jgi:hypothetical protein
VGEYSAVNGAPLFPIPGIFPNPGIYVLPQAIAQASAGNGIGVDQWGNSYVAGTLYPSSGGSQAMVFRLNANATLFGVPYVYPNPVPGWDSGTAIDVDPWGNCYVTGILANAAGTTDLWMTQCDTWLKFPPAPAQRWFSKSGAISIGGYGIRADALGQPYVAGYYGNKALVAKFNAALTAPVATFTFPSLPGPAYARAIALDTFTPPGVYVTGSFANYSTLFVTNF